jgi:phospholipid/cholesterol/gamma-HCH transport system substrate-binding protein
MNRSQFDLAVGAFVALGILALLFLAMKVGNLTGFDTGTAYVIEARFDNIGGLKVRLDGETYEAVARLRISSAFRFSKDTIAIILTSGLLGEQYIGLEPGGVPEYLVQGDRVMKTQSAMVLEKLISQFLFNKAAETPGQTK